MHFKRFTNFQAPVFNGILTWTFEVRTQLWHDPIKAIIWLTVGRDWRRRQLKQSVLNKLKYSAWLNFLRFAAIAAQLARQTGNEVTSKRHDNFLHSHSISLLKFPNCQKWMIQFLIDTQWQTVKNGRYGWYQKWKWSIHLIILPKICYPLELWDGQSPSNFFSLCSLSERSI